MTATAKTYAIVLEGGLSFPFFLALFRNLLSRFCSNCLLIFAVWSTKVAGCCFNYTYFYLLIVSSTDNIVFFSRWCVFSELHWKSPMLYNNLNSMLQKLGREWQPDKLSDRKVKTI